MPIDSTALVIQRLMKRFMTKSSAFNGMAFRNSALRTAPDDVANRDPLRDQAELEETIRDGLLGLDDRLRHRPDRERGAVRRNGLDFQWDARHRGECTGHRVAVRFRPPRGFRQA